MGGRLKRQETHDLAEGGNIWRQARLREKALQYGEIIFNEFGTSGT